jgi:acyl carrier protein
MAGSEYKSLKEGLPMAENLVETIKEIVTNIVHCDKEQLTSTTTWKELKADSLDIVQILIAAEDTFDIEISDEEAKGVANFGDFITYVERLVAGKS